MVKKDTLVSILIPSFNSALYLDDTIKSALNQSWAEKEIIIIDDGSTDDSVEIAAKYSSSGVKIYTQENSGASTARNLAFSKSSGSYIQYLDSDDILDPFKIENQLNLIEQGDEAHIISGCFRNFYTDPANSEIIKRDSGYRDFVKPIGWLIEAAWCKAMFPPMVWLTPRKLIEKAGPWNINLSYNDDPEFFSRVLLKSSGIIYCENSVSFYRRGILSSLGSRKDRKARESELDSLNLVTRHMIEHEDSIKVREACAYKYRKLIYSLFPNHLDLIVIAEAKLSELGINGSYNFGKGLTGKLGQIIGWKRAKLLKDMLIKNT